MTATPQDDSQGAALTRAPGADRPNGATARANGVNVPDLPLQVVDRHTGPAPRKSGILRRLRVLRFAPLIPLFLVTGGVVGMYFQPPGLKFVMRTFGIEPGGGTTTPIAVPAPAAEPPAPLPPPSVVGLGWLTPQGDVVTVAPPSGAGDARISAIAVEEDARVKKGDIVATLDNEARLRAAIDAANATVLVRQADVTRARDAVRASRDEAQAALDSAEAAADNARLDFERTKTLFDKGIVARSMLDAKRSAFDQAQKGVERAQATLSRYAGDIDEQGDVAVALKNLEYAETAAAQANENLEQAFVRAPIDGVVLDITARAGEKPGAAGVMDIGDIDRMVAKVEVFQTRIAEVEIGDKVELTAPALAEPLTGTVSRKGLQVKRQTVIGADPAANTDARVVEVTVALDPQSSAAASGFTNLQVEARIETGERAAQ